ncbi:MAG: HAD-IIIC family phosphatase [Bacillus sp. (in: Bacteria)]|nr:HAD-IIIC family phosphatase [Bacillus sp. (in: firmicutes)]MCM1425461.1 HAD-IIIC family phosphatase [Eubacterium sp.]
MRELEYPYDSAYIYERKKAINKELLANLDENCLHKKIAVLGGSTTRDIKLVLELFLLNYGIKPEFYESEFNQYYQDAMFPNPVLEEFAPDIVFVHTSIKNIERFPTVSDTAEAVQELLEKEYHKYTGMWKHLEETYHCIVIQNNFEYPYYRLLGNKDASDIHGKVNFITRLNCKFYEYAQENENFYINDINYLSARYGLEEWSNPFYWHSYKYALCVQAIPDLAFSVAKIIKSLYGKNKKAFVLDLDNTLWGGVVGDDGVENLVLGHETSAGQIYCAFQEYLKEYQELGVLLNIDSKNDYENALAGLQHPAGVLKADDFIQIKANWEPKDKNLAQIAKELNLAVDSMVFVDDNPAEREIVRKQMPGVAVPELERPEEYIKTIDGSGFFEMTLMSEDDKNRTRMYQENRKRAKEEAAYENYEDYLKSLQMKAQIQPFTAVYMARIAQLTNKSNQFNLTTKRYSQTEIEEIAKNPDYLTLYGRLEDKFGDNGVISVVIGQKEGEILHIRLWLMSCRVLKRDMEYAMMDTLVMSCRKQDITEIRGYYYPTAKNNMVKEFYSLQGFDKIEEDAAGNTVWRLSLADGYQKKNQVILVE